MLREGHLIAVCKSNHGGLYKVPCEGAIIDPFGLRGDFHCRERYSRFPGIWKENTDRHILILGWEAIAAVNEELGLDPPLVFGTLAENFTSYGLGDLSDVLPGSKVIIRGRIELRVTKQNKPCGNTAVLHPLFNRTIYNNEKKRRGILCAVVRGVGEHVAPGDEITIISP